jgi:hypothetical protein
MVSVFDICTVGLDEDDELVFEFTEEFLELTFDERIELLTNLSDHAMSIVDAALDIDDAEIAGELPLSDEDDDDDDAFDAEELA